MLFLFANPPPTPPANFLKMDSSIHKKWNSPHTTLVTSCSYIHGRSHICAIKRRHHAIAAEENRLDRIEGTLINKMQPSMVQVVSTWKSFCVSGPQSEKCQVFCLLFVILIGTHLPNQQNPNCMPNVSFGHSTMLFRYILRLAFSIRNISWELRKKSRPYSSEQNLLSKLFS